MAVLLGESSLANATLAGITSGAAMAADVFRKSRLDVLGYFTGQLHGNSNVYAAAEFPICTGHSTETAQI